jgi:hypothetical protein
MKLSFLFLTRAETLKFLAEKLIISNKSSLKPTKIPPTVFFAGKENQLNSERPAMALRKLGSIFSYFVSWKTINSIL